MMPFIDLQTQRHRIEKQVHARFQKVFEHGRYIEGPENECLESLLAEYVGVKHALGVSSGTDALLMALMALGIGPGDAVFTTPFTFVATAEVIALLGATPVFVDIDANTLNLDPVALERAVTTLKHASPQGGRKPTPKAILAVDLFGLCCDYERICSLAEREGLVVIEDAAQSFGAEQNGRRAGSFGRVGCTSFFPAKPLGCYGDGGAIFTNDDALAQKMKSIRGHGQGKTRSQTVRLGINGRLDTLQAAVLLCKLDIFDDERNLRNTVAATYTEGLKPAAGHLRCQQIPNNCRSAWAQFAIILQDADVRARVQEKLREVGVPTAIYYSTPLSRQPAFHYLGYGKGSMPVSEDVARRIFAVPMHPYLTPTQINTITATIVEVFSA